jgi:hypothetical protein
MLTKLFDQIFRNEQGDLVIAQMPNPPLIAWIAASLLQLLFPSGKAHLGLDLLAFGSLFTWAWLELFDGVNYFRRTLGLCTLMSIIASRILASLY